MAANPDYAVDGVDVENYCNGQVWESPNGYHQRIVFWTGKKNENGEWIYWLLSTPHNTGEKFSRTAVIASTDGNGKQDYTQSELAIRLENWKLRPELGLELT